MANGDFEIEGYNELLKKLANLGGKLENEITEEALLEGAEPVRAKVEENTPKSALKKEHAKAHIVIKRTNLKGKISIEPAKDFWYLKFPEFGTSSQPAQQFFERSAREATAEARKRMAEVFRRRLGL